RLGDPRREERPPVGERRVSRGELERSDEQVTLADGEAHVVTWQPQRTLALLLRVGLVGVEPRLPLLIGYAPVGLTRETNAGRLAEAVRLCRVLDRVALLDRVVARLLAGTLLPPPLVVALPHVAADVVEVRVAGDRERALEVHRAVRG